VSILWGGVLTPRKERRPRRTSGWVVLAQVRDVGRAERVAWVRRQMGGKAKTKKTEMDANAVGGEG